MKPIYLILLFYTTLVSAQDTTYKKLLNRMPYILYFTEQSTDSKLAAIFNGKGFQYSNISIHYTYDVAYPFIKEHALVMYNGRYGVIDRRGGFVIEPVFSKIRQVDDCFIFDEKLHFSFLSGRSCEEISCPFPIKTVRITKTANNKYQLFSEISKKELLKIAYDSIRENNYLDAGGFYLVNRGKKWGLVKAGPEYIEVISPKYVEAQFIGVRYVALKNSSGSWHYYNLKDTVPKLLTRSSILCDKYNCSDKEVIGIFKTTSGKYNLLFTNGKTMEEFDFINSTGVVGIQGNKVYIIKNKKKELLIEMQ